MVDILHHGGVRYLLLLCKLYCLFLFTKHVTGTQHYCAYRVFDWCFSAIDNEQVKSLVLKGNRPPLDAVTGPAGLVSFAKRWISLCWHKSPDKRPSFHGKHRSSYRTWLTLFLFLIAAELTNHSTTSVGLRYSQLHRQTMCQLQTSIHAASKAHVVMM